MLLQWVPQREIGRIVADLQGKVHIFHIPLRREMQEASYKVRRLSCQMGSNSKGKNRWNLATGLLLLVVPENNLGAPELFVRSPYTLLMLLNN